MDRFDLYSGIMEMRMSDEEREYQKELEKSRLEYWKEPNTWIYLDGMDEFTPTFNCIILLRDYESKKFLVARYEFEVFKPMPYFGGDDYCDDDGGWEWHFYNIETGEEYDSDEICNTYPYMMVIKRLENERKETEEV